MEFKENLQTKNVGFGKNTCEFIILHHTGTPPGTTKGNLNVLLGNTTRKVSAHYLVSDNGDIYKLAKDDDITFHAGTSNWKGKTDLNKYAIGIEVVGPGFTDIQREKVGELIVYLAEKYNINQENIIRHKDVCIPTGRKTDIDDSFWNSRFPSWADYVKSLFTKKEIMGAYEEQFKRKYGNGSVFNDIDGGLEKCINQDGTINAKEFFYFVMIGLERVSQKIPQNGNMQSQAKT